MADSPSGLRTRHQRRSLMLMLLVIVALHVLGWGLFVLAVLPGNYRLGGTHAFGLGVALAAYTLGIRHAFDADHIAAIDNTTRKLVEQHGPARPLGVGFWFALGHSTVVLVAVGLLAGGFNLLAAQLADDQSPFLRAAGLWGALVSGLFLLLLGGTNLASLNNIRKLLAGYQQGTYLQEELEETLRRRGILNRLLAPVVGMVDRPAKMYPVGLLFGLGFDTATTIGLFVIAGGAALTLPWYVVLVLPLLFAAGMVTCDTVDGLLMQRAYQWAFDHPLRRLYYNLVVTSVSVVVAFLVAAVVLFGALSEGLNLTTGPVAWVAGLDLENFGFIVAAAFLLIWAAALAYWKFSAAGQRQSGS
ncbi:HoxN/HupN/NixA family nickel/cobalt transporter [Arthrobacter sp. I2-34]|uniref:Nickel/cobalt efflux system n=1 Tax=Arthrobacter hankyongi TaxID=2904801 RepID=A0ABS9L8S2_9MICC|nr:HoxN/HupN/NixA family nickel/cobalt transporter [Arthrobacter hankyongi]MCG2622889.1 HoxN/HupN/NixA family nickel/cobalt transporter [Arthrobacter hankyongi]